MEIGSMDSWINGLVVLNYPNKKKGKQILYHYCPKKYPIGSVDLNQESFIRRFWFNKQFA